MNGDNGLLQVSPVVAPAGGVQPLPAHVRTPGTIQVVVHRDGINGHR
jgi:hypothetical protein